MKKITFSKYTSFGNNFVIVDELRKRQLTESEARVFAHEATNPCFGIGCDNLLVIQRRSRSVLREIQEHWGYWETAGTPAEADLLFRMFEPNGIEALSCGNGLMSVAHMLRAMHGVESASILTEVPMSQPRVVRLGAESDGSSWADIGLARQTPDTLVDRSTVQPLNQWIDVVEPFSIRFRAEDLRAYTEMESLRISAYLVFTGEPHLVVFPDDCFEDKDLAATLFAQPGAEVSGSVGRRLSVGSWLVRRVGGYLNEKCKDRFPLGINVNFAAAHPDVGAIEYRCFERGIERETLACGTGAAAVFTVAKALGKIGSNDAMVYPHLCRRYSEDATLRVRQDDDTGALRLYGWPRCLFSGEYNFEDHGQVHLPGQNDTTDFIALERQLESRPLVPSSIRAV